MSIEGSYKTDQNGGMILTIRKADAKEGFMSGSLELSFQGERVGLVMTGWLQRLVGKRHQTALSFGCVQTGDGKVPIFVQGWSGYCHDESPSHLTLQGNGMQVYSDTTTTIQFDTDKWQRVK